MVIEGTHYSPNCSCKNCKRIKIMDKKASLQKESEWESEFESRFHTTNNDYDGGKMLWVQKEEVKSFLKEIISNREKEIAEEVDRMEVYDDEPDNCRRILTEVLLIIKKH